MDKPKKVLPKFESEEDEIRFWSENDIADWLEAPSDIIIRLKKRPKKTITMRLDVSIYEQLKEVAAKHGVPYQRLMQELLRQSLRKLAAEEA